MKIAICIGQSTLGGVGTSTYILANGIRKAGHHADILATDGKIGPDHERALHDGWPIEAICAHERWLRRRLEIVLDRLSIYDVVINNHSTETKLLLPALPADTIRLSVIRSTDSHPIEEARQNSQYLNSLVGISPQVTELLKRSQVKTEVNTIPNAVLVKNNNLPQLSFPLRISFIGRLEDRQKNILILPDIAKILSLSGLDFKIIVIGDGPQRSELEKKIIQMHLENVFEIRGEMKREAAWDVFTKTHLALLPSHFEGFGLVLAEAMAAGAVPITSDIPVFRWILGKDARILCASVKNAAAYAERIQSLAANHNQYLEIQGRLKKRQLDKFTPEATVRGYLQLINRLKREHTATRFRPVTLQSLPLSKDYQRQCSHFWRVLQKGKDLLRVK